MAGSPAIGWIPDRVADNYVLDRYWTRAEIREPIVTAQERTRALRISRTVIGGATDVGLQRHGIR